MAGSDWIEERLEKAVAAERERCAKIADDMWKKNDKLTKSPGWDSACLKIAAAIRTQ
jgi:hypothetical protein